MSFKTPMNRVLGLGTARAGVEHWWSQRLGAAAMVPLTLLAILPLGRSIGAGLDAVRATYADPWNAIVLILFLAVGFRHLHLGVQVVVEDYVHHKPARTAAMFANTAFCAIMGLAGVFGVLKLALTA